VSSFLTAHQHIIGYSVPYNGLENAIKDGKYNQGHLATAESQTLLTDLGVRTEFTESQTNVINTPTITSDSDNDS